MSAGGGTLRRMTEAAAHEWVDRELRWAVTDGPDGTRVIDAPEDARQLKENVKRGLATLHCSTRVGGCGEELIVVAGEVYAHHFRHRPSARCSLTASEARDRYTHLRIQVALLDWLTGQGLRATKEERLDHRSRVDVFVAETRQVLEVQLSPLDAIDWKVRHERYTDKDVAVWWLNGLTNAAVIVEQRRQDGHALLVRLDGEQVDLGVDDADGERRFAPLDQWRMTVDGPWNHLVDEASELAATRRAETAEVEERARQVAARQADRVRAQEEERRTSRGGRGATRA